MISHRNLRHVQRTLADYVVEIAKIKPNQLKFVILDGSTAAGENRRFSDFDVVVVRRGSEKVSSGIE